MSDEVVAPDASVIARDKLAGLIFAGTVLDAHASLTAADTAVAAGWRPPAQVIDDAADVPVRAVIWWPADKTIAARFDETLGVVLGDDRPFAWSVIKGPVTVVWEPGDPR